MIGLNILSFQSAFATEMAITVDDLPAHESLPSFETRSDISNKILAVFKKHHITGVYGFVNGEKIKQQPSDLSILQTWIQQGQLLGNHTFSHLDLTQVTTGRFIADIQKNELILTKLIPTNDTKYFRYPFLAEGNTQAKRDAIRNYLKRNHYVIAPVTVDFFDYQWNAPYVRCLKQQRQEDIRWLQNSYIDQAMQALTVAHSLSQLVFKRNIRQILLIHMGAFDAEMLDELLTRYEKAGVKFIPLAVALQDNAFKVNPNVTLARTYTFLNQMRLSRGYQNPNDVREIYNNLPEDKLAKLCK